MPRQHAFRPLLGQPVPPKRRAGQQRLHHRPRQLRGVHGRRPRQRRCTRERHRGRVRLPQHVRGPVRHGRRHVCQVHEPQQCAFHVLEGLQELRGWRVPPRARLRHRQRSERSIRFAAVLRAVRAVHVPVHEQHLGRLAGRRRGLERWPALRPRGRRRAVQRAVSAAGHRLVPHPDRGEAHPVRRERDGPGLRPPGVPGGGRLVARRLPLHGEQALEGLQEPARLPDRRHGLGRRHRLPGPDPAPERVDPRGPGPGQLDGSRLRRPRGHGHGRARPRHGRWPDVLREHRRHRDQGLRRAGPAGRELHDLRRLGRRRCIRLLRQRLAGAVRGLRDAGREHHRDPGMHPRRGRRPGLHERQVRHRRRLRRGAPARVQDRWHGLLQHEPAERGPAGDPGARGLRRVRRQRRGGLLSGRELRPGVRGRRVLPRRGREKHDVPLGRQRPGRRVRPAEGLRLHAGHRRPARGRMRLAQRARHPVLLGAAVLLRHVRVHGRWRECGVPLLRRRRVREHPLPRAARHHDGRALD
mmetsp:Transcript_9035/g.27032  ORF Transcript_9035/g.27032 Transcript_9035/m.27032 type:complete len:526 (+) Transcript_9035:1899-3476(+)